MDGMVKGLAPFGNAYKGRRVFVTGHTGFKGSWLCAWLLSLGADVTGYSLYIPSHPSHFELIGLDKKMTHLEGDVRDYERLRKAIEQCSPDIIFHLAAQALTRKSYAEPLETFTTNIVGSVNILECIRNHRSVIAAVMITSDKCYQNVEWVWGYRENDRLGGGDPYSASKACAEVASHSYMNSYFTENGTALVATGRAGNVIGGGDWAADRIVPDCVRAFSKGEDLVIRSAAATRPWQHVLEPLSGYLQLGANLLKGVRKVASESFNFGPSGFADRTVKDLIAEFSTVWGGGKWRIIESAGNKQKKEALLLRLNCDKALSMLSWCSVLNFGETVEMTAGWYRTYYKKTADMFEVTAKQIEKYAALARERKLRWATGA
jgi:CDP-glucose 4,6-dehydratase